MAMTSRTSSVRAKGSSEATTHSSSPATPPDDPSTEKSPGRVLIRIGPADVHPVNLVHHPGGAMPVLANIVGPELLIVLAVVALLFGSTRLPQLARSLGSAKSEFERGL